MNPQGQHDIDKKAVHLFECLLQQKSIRKKIGHDHGLIAHAVGALHRAELSRAHPALLRLLCSFAHAPSSKFRLAISSRISDVLPLLASPDLEIREQAMTLVHTVLSRTNSTRNSSGETGRPMPKDGAPPSMRRTQSAGSIWRMLSSEVGKLAPRLTGWFSRDRSEPEEKSSTEDGMAPAVDSTEESGSLSRDIEEKQGDWETVLRRAGKLYGIDDPNEELLTLLYPTAPSEKGAVDVGIGMSKLTGEDREPTLSSNQKVIVEMLDETDPKRLARALEVSDILTLQSQESGDFGVDIDEQVVWDTLLSRLHTVFENLEPKLERGELEQLSDVQALIDKCVSCCSSTKNGSLNRFEPVRHIVALVSRVGHTLGGSVLMSQLATTVFQDRLSTTTFLLANGLEALLPNDGDFSDSSTACTPEWVAFLKKVCDLDLPQEYRCRILVKLISTTSQLIEQLSPSTPLVVLRVALSIAMTGGDLLRQLKLASSSGLEINRSVLQAFVTQLHQVVDAINQKPSSFAPEALCFVGECVGVLSGLWSSVAVGSLEPAVHALVDNLAIALAAEGYRWLDFGHLRSSLWLLSFVSFHNFLHSQASQPAVLRVLKTLFLDHSDDDISVSSAVHLVLHRTMLLRSFIEVLLAADGNTSASCGCGFRQAHTSEVSQEQERCPSLVVRSNWASHGTVELLMQTIIHDCNVIINHKGNPQDGNGSDEEEDATEVAPKDPTNPQSHSSQSEVAPADQLELGAFIDACKVEAAWTFRALAVFLRGYTYPGSPVYQDVDLPFLAWNLQQAGIGLDEYVFESLVHLGTWRLPRTWVNLSFAWVNGILALTKEGEHGYVYASSPAEENLWSSIIYSNAVEVCHSVVGKKGRFTTWLAHQRGFEPSSPRQGVHTRTASPFRSDLSSDTGASSGSNSFELRNELLKEGSGRETSFVLAPWTQLELLAQSILPLSSQSSTPAKGTSPSNSLPLRLTNLMIEDKVSAVSGPIKVNRHPGDTLFLWEYETAAVPSIETLGIRSVSSETFSGFRGGGGGGRAIPSGNVWRDSPPLPPSSSPASPRHSLDDSVAGRSRSGSDIRSISGGSFSSGMLSDSNAEDSLALGHGARNMMIRWGRIHAGSLISNAAQFFGPSSLASCPNPVKAKVVPYFRSTVAAASVMLLLPSAPASVQSSCIRLLQKLVAVSPINASALDRMHCVSFLLDFIAQYRTNGISFSNLDQYIQLVSRLMEYNAREEDLEVLLELIRGSADPSAPPFLRRSLLSCLGQAISNCTPASFFYFPQVESLPSAFQKTWTPWVSSPPIYNFPDPTVGYSLFMWIQIASLPPEEETVPLLVLDVDGAPALQLELSPGSKSEQGISNQYFLALRVVDVTESDPVLTSRRLLLPAKQWQPSSRWHMITLSHTSDLLQLAVDGVEMAVTSGRDVPRYPAIRVKNEPSTWKDRWRGKRLGKAVVLTLNPHPSQSVPAKLADGAASTYYPFHGGFGPAVFIKGAISLDDAKEAYLNRSFLDLPVNQGKSKTSDKSGGFLSWLSRPTKSVADKSTEALLANELEEMGVSKSILGGCIPSHQADPQPFAATVRSPGRSPRVASEHDVGKEEGSSNDQTPPRLSRWNSGRLEIIDADAENETRSRSLSPPRRSVLDSPPKTPPRGRTRTMSLTLRVGGDVLLTLSPNRSRLQEMPHTTTHKKTKRRRALSESYGRSSFVAASLLSVSRKSHLLPIMPLHQSDATVDTRVESRRSSFREDTPDPELFTLHLTRCPFSIFMGPSGILNLFPVLSFRGQDHIISVKVLSDCFARCPALVQNFTEADGWEVLESILAGSAADWTQELGSAFMSLVTGHHDRFPVPVVTKLQEQTQPTHSEGANSRWSGYDVRIPDAYQTMVRLCNPAVARSFPSIDTPRIHAVQARVVQYIADMVEENPNTLRLWFDESRFGIFYAVYCLQWACHEVGSADDFNEPLRVPMLRLIRAMILAGADPGPGLADGHEVVPSPQHIMEAVLLAIVGNRYG